MQGINIIQGQSKYFETEKNRTYAFNCYKKIKQQRKTAKHQ